MLEAGVRYINEAFEADRVSASELDMLLADGWRHFGTHFFRYSLGIHDFDIRLVIPLRVRLPAFTLSKSQRRVLRQNSDLTVTVRPIELTDDSTALFERHKQRFKFGVPDSIHDFLSDQPATVPCEAREVDVRLDGRLVAVSYFDLGERSISAIYGVFDPDLPRRSLGIFTMLKEIELAIDSRRDLYYQGYVYEGQSFYDYKKRFGACEGFDWNGNWKVSEFGR
ncbi:MAG TPA: GNAT family N-acetyltransferase [Pyrinomonadaceae bacterium]|nr:GNAT family N-acetyltransferase [Pyrinomonadaceae bacterium]